MNQDHPRHIAIIMDGNGRWAAQRGLPRIAGHRAGVSTVRRVVEECARLRIPYLTLFAFSTENWRRPEEEVGALMVLLEQYLKRELANLMKNNVRLNTIGRLNDLPENVRRTLEDVTARSSANTGLTLTLALSYSGRDDIVQAVRRIAMDVSDGTLDPGAIDHDGFSSRLDTHDMPDPDLLIRTSGEMRISNFLLWEIAYTEFYVTQKLWPDFGDEDLHEALDEYKRRERRFGMTSDQVGPESR
ncbi:MAG: isoprenyl transferase [bacterium]|nr:isoprenyl transferase [bacterium]